MTTVLPALTALLPLLTAVLQFAATMAAARTAKDAHARERRCCNEFDDAS
ncbi:hypothetical protein [Actinoplanes regularis]|nr:hypothetical protein [Actinoplanes regularis]